MGRVSYHKKNSVEYGTRAQQSYLNIGVFPREEKEERGSGKEVWEGFETSLRIFCSTLVVQNTVG